MNAPSLEQLIDEAVGIDIRVEDSDKRKRLILQALNKICFMFTRSIHDVSKQYLLMSELCDRLIYLLPETERNAKWEFLLHKRLTWSTQLKKREDYRRFALSLFREANSPPRKVEEAVATWLQGVKAGSWLKFDCAKPRQQHTDSDVESVHGDDE